jgi:hypothetical protein
MLTFIHASPTKYHPAQQQQQCLTGDAHRAHAPQHPPACSALTTQAPACKQDASALLILQSRLAQSQQSSKQQLWDAASVWQAQLAAAQAAAGAQAEALQLALAMQHAARQRDRMLAACLSSWRQVTQQQGRAARRQQLLGKAWAAWLQAPSHARCATRSLQGVNQQTSCDELSRHSLSARTCARREARHAALGAVLQCWCRRAAERALAARKVKRQQRRHLRRVLLAWKRQCAAQLDAIMECVAWASRRRRWRVQHTAFSAWLTQAERTSSAQLQAALLVRDPATSGMCACCTHVRSSAALQCKTHPLKSATT